MRVRAFFAVLLTVLAVGEVHADPDDRAREVASEQLALMVGAGSKLLGSTDMSKLASATLGDPILIYGAQSVFDTTFFAYEKANAADILRYSASRTLCYPVVIDGEVRSSINVAEIDDEYLVVGGYQRDFGKLVARFRELREQLRLRANQRLSILDTTVGGHFYVVEDGELVHQMAPADVGTMRRFAVPGTVGDPSTFFEPSHFVSQLREEISRAGRQRSLSDSPTDLGPRR